jgi:uncharacterized protein (TIGR02611 family)
VTYVEPVSDTPSSPTPTTHDPAKDDDDDFEGPIDKAREWRERIRQNKSLNHTYRIVVAILGTVIILAGIALLPLPGPGWLIIFLGLGLLASEFDWAKRVLDYAKKKVGAWTDWVQEQNWFVRILLGLACLAIVLGAVYGFIWWQGLPSWTPDWVPFVHDIPTRD